MKFKNRLIPLSIGAILAASSTVAVSASHETPGTWFSVGKQTVMKNKATAKQTSRSISHHAKNIILFVGDGMGISTVTAARILEGQMLGLDGEEHQLFFETFPNIALAKTYNTN